MKSDTCTQKRISLLNDREAFKEGNLIFQHDVHSSSSVFEYTVSELKEGNTPGLRHIFLTFLRQHHQLCFFKRELNSASSIGSQSCAGFYGAAGRSVVTLHESKCQPHGLCVTGKLKLDRDFSKYNYLSLDSAAVSGLDDAANFRTVRVSRAHTCVRMTGGARRCASPS